MKQCTQCGKCCINYSDGGLTASQSEIEFWEAFRPHIYQYVKNDELWFDPVTGQQLSICPFLRKEVSKVPDQQKYTCDIYHNRPEDCRFYPVTIDQMIYDECEMLQPRDLNNTKKAQVSLDGLTEDSRPAFS
ncbi:MAG: YkgJ family cysteine cluster protein [Alcanivoracaceae bacterium]|nr:YkgJ family cysteine cluster protein [Alcanivoracaceae bacterium]